MKQTLLQMVQNILLSMDSDMVNSISDTIEAQQVAEVVRDTYYEILGSRLWPTERDLIRLNSSTDSTLPTVMYLPDDVSKIEWIHYTFDEDDFKYTNVKWMDPEDFIKMTTARGLSEDRVDAMIYNGHTIKILNDVPPSYYTSFDDETLIFDSYDSDVDSILQSSKILVWAEVIPAFEMSDTFIPDLPMKAWPYFLSEAKSTAFAQIKQMPNAKEEQRSRRQRTFLAVDKHRMNGELKTTNFGRRPVK